MASSTPLSPTRFAILGAFRLARFDASGFQHFIATPAGFWHSCLAVLLVAPMQVVLVHLVGEQFPDHPPMDGLATVNYLLSFAVQWLAWPLVMLNFAARIDRDRQIMTYLVAYNWVNLPQVTIFLAVTAMTSSGMLSGGLAQLLTFASFVYFMALKAFVARRALALGRGLTVAVVGLDLALSFLLASLVETI